MAFRCAAASMGRDEPLLGTASTVRAFLLVENAGPWGVDALLDSRLPDEVKDGLRQRAERARVRPLLVRRHQGRDNGPGIRVFAAYADPSAPWLVTATVAAPEVLLDLDLDALGRGESPGLTPVDGPLFCVCTHGRHDACCAELGRPTASVLASAYPEETWEVSHIGGDRFAANLLVLPDGLYYGRLDPDSAADVAARHVEGHLDLDRLRGRSGLAFPAQVAEVALRRHLGETGRDAVRVLSVNRSADDPRLTAVTFRAAGATYAVRVRRIQDDLRHQLTCRAQRDNPIPAYDVLDVSRVTSGAPSSAPPSTPSPRG